MKKHLYGALVAASIATFAFLVGFWRGAQPTVESDAAAYYRVHRLFKEVCDSEGGTLVIKPDGKPSCPAK